MAPARGHDSSAYSWVVAAHVAAVIWHPLGATVMPARSITPLQMGHTVYALALCADLSPVSRAAFVRVRRTRSTA